jgi:hypothetical protein
MADWARVHGQIHQGDALWGHPRKHMRRAIRRATDIKRVRSDSDSDDADGDKRARRSDRRPGPLQRTWDVLTGGGRQNDKSSSSDESSSSSSSDDELSFPWAETPPLIARIAGTFGERAITPSSTKVTMDAWNPNPNTVSEQQNIIEVTRHDGAKKFVYISYRANPHTMYDHPIVAWRGPCFQVDVIYVMNTAVTMVDGHTGDSDTKGFGKILLEKIQNWATERAWGVGINNIVSDGWLVSLQSGRYGMVDVISAWRGARVDAYVATSLDGTNVLRVDLGVLTRAGLTEPARHMSRLSIEGLGGAIVRLLDRKISTLDDVRDFSLFVEGGQLARRYTMARSGFATAPLHKLVTGFTSSRSPVAISRVAPGDTHTPGTILARGYIYAPNKDSSYVMVGGFYEDFAYVDTVDPGTDAGFLGMWVYHTFRPGDFAKMGVPGPNAVTDADVADAMTLRMSIDTVRDVDGERTEPWIKTLLPVAQKWVHGRGNTGARHWMPVGAESFDLARIRRLTPSPHMYITVRLLYRLD